MRHASAVPLALVLAACSSHVPATDGQAVAACRARIQSQIADEANYRVYVDDVGDRRWKVSLWWSRAQPGGGPTGPADAVCLAHGDGSSVIVESVTLA